MAARHPRHLPRRWSRTTSCARSSFRAVPPALPKGIVLSNRNFIAEGMQVAAWGGLGESRHRSWRSCRSSTASASASCVNAVVPDRRRRSILVPQFSPEIVAEAAARRSGPTLLVGRARPCSRRSHGPVAREAPTSPPSAPRFSGADTLPRAGEASASRALVAERGGTVRLLEGYGLTEAVSAIMAMPLDEYREGSIGVPFPDMLADDLRAGDDEGACRPARRARSACPGRR